MDNILGELVPAGYVTKAANMGSVWQKVRYGAFQISYLKGWTSAVWSDCYIGLWW